MVPAREALETARPGFFLRAGHRLNFQTPRRKRGVQNTPYGLCKQFRHKAPLLSVLRVVATLPKPSSQAPAKGLISKLAFKSDNPTGQLC